MNNKIVRKQILESFLENIAGISDKEYQKRIWIRGEGPECDNFDDTVCDFFDLGESIFNSYKNYDLTDIQYHLLITFRDEFRAFSDKNNWPEQFIDTPEWDRIVEMAKEVLQAFHYQKK